MNQLTRVLRGNLNQSLAHLGCNACEAMHGLFLILSVSTDDNDATYSIMFQVKMTKKALTDLRTYLKQRQTQQGAINAALRKMPGLNHRQRSVIEDALRYPDRLYTFQGYKVEFSITYVTARNDLLALKKLNFLEETKIGRQRAFIPVEHLVESIEAIGC